MAERVPIESALRQRTVALVPASQKIYFTERPWLLALALLVITLAAYQPVWHARFIWDDDAYVTNNITLRTFDGLRRIWFELGATQQYYPLTYTAFWAEYHLWGLNPLGYHLVNVSLHALNAILVWLVLRTLQVKGGWLAAAIFAVHPVHVESVAWVTERKNVLSGFFYLGALLVYLRVLTGGAAALDFTPKTGAKPWSFYWLALGLYLCALCAKTVTCTLPLVILLLVWWKRGRLEWRDVGAVLPFLALGIGMGVTTTLGETVEKEGWNFSIAERFVLAGRNLWFYAGKLVWPSKLTFVYPRWQLSPSLWWEYLYPLGAAGVLWGLWALRKRWGRGPLVAVLVFAGTLSVALGFFNIYYFRYSFVADHFQYLASLGIITLAASGMAHVLDRGKLWLAPMGHVICLVLLAVLAGLTSQQATVYRDAQTLWRDTLAKNPGAWMAHNNLGGELLASGKASEAMLHYMQALRLQPDSAEVHNDFGNALIKLGKIQEGIEHFERAVRLKPDYAVAHNNLGVVLSHVGKFEEAIAHYQDALRIKSDYAEAHYNLGNALLELGKAPEAIEHYEKALQIKPGFAKAHQNLGFALEQLGRIEDALGHYEQALRIKPDYAEVHYNLGVTLAQSGRTQEAIWHLEQALRINPNYAEAHNDLGAELAHAGKLGEAIGHYEQALRVKPDFATAHNNLGNALMQTGKFEDAIGHYEQALRLKPDYAEAHYNLGVSLEQAGRVREAMEHYEQALRLKPNFAEAQKRLARLQAIH